MYENAKDLHDALHIIAQGEQRHKPHVATWIMCACDVLMLGAQNDLERARLRQLRLFLWRRTKHHRYLAIQHPPIAPSQISKLVADHQNAIANGYMRIIQTLNDFVPGTAERDDLDDLPMPEYLK